VLVLALDTTSRSGSAAVVIDGEVRGEIIGDPSRTHGERLPGDLMRALAEANVTLAEIDLLAVATGPGSFTGLRVGIAAMQGLAMSLDRRIVPISALDALAAAGGGDAGPVAVWIDAQRGEVFAALYDSAGSEMISAPSALTPAGTLAAWGAGGGGGRTRGNGQVLFIGDGAVRYEGAIREVLGPAPRIIPAPPLAAVIGRLAAAAPERAVLPHAVVPVYVRRSDAELARLRRST
jgi:tRNA threonylcarbamoyladenosine biosynthesis protein TsaB